MIALLLFLFPLAYSPGPGNLFFAANGARFGIRQTLPANAGYHIATFAITFLIGIGFSNLVILMPNFLLVLKWAGGAYVLYLAYRFLKAGQLGSQSKIAPPSFGAGALLLILNPKAYVIITLMFTQFLDANSSSMRVLVISLIFTLNNFLAFIIWTVLGDKLASQFRNEKYARRINCGFGLMLGVIAIWMLSR